MVSRVKIRCAPINSEHVSISPWGWYVICWRMNFISWGINSELPISYTKGNFSFLRALRGYRSGRRRRHREMYIRVGSTPKWVSGSSSTGPGLSSLRCSSPGNSNRSTFPEHHHCQGNCFFVLEIVFFLI